MTSPKNARRGKSGREYVWPTEPPHELEVPSVTTITEKLPKYLVPWASLAVAEYAYDHREAWEKLPREDAVYLLKGVTKRSKESGGDRGREVHKAIAAHILGEEYELANHLLPYLDAALAFVDDYEVIPEHCETTVYSRTHGYAGTFDLLARFRNNDPPGLWMVDFKTSKNIYDSFGAQLSAYAEAEFMDVDGVEVPMPRVDGGLAVRLSPRGSYEPVPFDLQPGLFGVFLAAKCVYEWETGLAKNVRGDPWKAAA